MPQPWPWVKVTKRSPSTFPQTHTCFAPNNWGLAQTILTWEAEVFVARRTWQTWKCTENISHPSLVRLNDSNHHFSDNVALTFDSCPWKVNQPWALWLAMCVPHMTTHYGIGFWALCGRMNTPFEILKSLRPASSTLQNWKGTHQLLTTCILGTHRKISNE